MGEAAEKYKETAKFISDNMKLNNESPEKGKKYQVNQEQYHEFLGAKGITKDTIRQFAEATAEYNSGTVLALEQILLDNPEDPRATINTRTSNGVLSTYMNRMVETKMPKTGELMTKFGSVVVKLDLRSRVDKDLLRECSAEIEAASK